MKKISVFYDHILQAKDQTGLGVDNIIQKVYDSGIAALEINFDMLIEHKEWLLPILSKVGMGISCIYQFYDLGNDTDITKLKKHVDTAKEVGAKNILVVPGFLASEEATKLNELIDSFRKYSDPHNICGEEAYNATKEFMDNSQAIVNMKNALMEAVKYAGEKGITITLEDFDGKTAPFARINELRWFMENVPGIKYTLDMGNLAYSDEDIMAGYNVLKKYIVHVHCKDRGESKYASPKAQYNKGLNTVAVGDGYLPVRGLVEILSLTGYKGYYAIEHFDAENQLEYMQKSARFLNKYII